MCIRDSATYVAGKERDCAECGITSQVVRLPADTPQAQLVAEVQAASADSAVSGVLVQLPLPAHISEAAVIAAIAPHKDVDGFTPVNAGRMLLGQPCFVPCTPAGCLAMLRAANVPIAGRRAVVLGRSNIVGKPMALLLMRENATVTVCHSHTEGLAGVCRGADILVAAVGRAGFVTADMVKPGAAVIDVGINRNAKGRPVSYTHLARRLLPVRRRGKFYSFHLFLSWKIVYNLGWHGPGGPRRPF